ncbi:MAG: hypothetical protein Q8N84_02495 [bacterium]|nr:hypothetical protein [bacterium]
MKKLIFPALLVVGVIIGVILTTILLSNNFKLPKILNSVAERLYKASPQPANSNQEDAKRTSLEKFYVELSTAEENLDSAKVYNLLHPKDKEILSLDKFIQIRSKNKLVSIKYTLHSVEVVGDKGFVDRTTVSCSTEQCTGEDRKEERSKREYQYLDGQWYWYRFGDKKPSERALKLTATYYINVNEQSKQKMKDFVGSEDVSTVIRCFAIYLNDNPERLAYLEAGIEKSKTEASKPNVYVQPPDVIVEEPSFSQPIQQPSYPQHCTSTPVGDTVFTNCY